MSSQGTAGLYFKGGDAVALPAVYRSAPISLNSTGTIILAVPGKRIKIFAIKLVVSAIMSIQFRDGQGNVLEGLQAMLANSGFVECVNPPTFLFGTTQGNSLDMVISGAGSVGGRVSYWADDVT